MTEEVKIFIISMVLGAASAPLLWWLFNKTKIGKKESRTEIEEKNW